MKPMSIQYPSDSSDFIFTDNTKEIFNLRNVVAESDAMTLHDWFATEHARFWYMPDKSVTGVKAYYKKMQQSAHARAFLGFEKDQPSFLIECYNPINDQIAKHYPTLPGDLGLHLFIAPPIIRTPNFTSDVFRFALDFMFTRLGALRIVVEPDVNNTKIHGLNRRMGFRYIGQACLPEKNANIAVCTRDDFEKNRPHTN